MSDLKHLERKGKRARGSVFFFPWDQDRWFLWVSIMKFIIVLDHCFFCPESGLPEGSWSSYAYFLLYWKVWLNVQRNESCGTVRIFSENFRPHVPPPA